MAGIHSESLKNVYLDIYRGMLLTTHRVETGISFSCGSSDSDTIPKTNNNEGICCDERVGATIISNMAAYEPEVGPTVSG